MFLLGVGIGLVITAAILWSERDTLRRGLRQRRAGLFGEENLEVIQDPSSPVHSRGQTGASRHRRHLAIAVCFLAVLSSAFVAIQTSDETVRLVNIAACAILAAGGGTLLLRRTD